MMTRRDPVMFAWVAGLSLAALIYALGPDRVMFRIEDTLHVVLWRLGEIVADLSATALDVVRALSIGLFATFLALSVAVARRGGRARMAGVVVTLLFVGLVEGAAPGDQARWTAALVLSAVAASVMTGRLRQTGPRLP